MQTKMNKKAQAEIIGLFIEFLTVFFLLKAVGPVIYQISSSVPLGFIFQAIFPSPEDSVLDFMKALIESGIITGVTSLFL